MNKYEFWDIRYKYEDCDNVEIRPVLIINDVNFFICMKATTKDTHPDSFSIFQWRESGLNEPTYLRLTKVFRADKTDFVRKRGVLLDNDRMRLELALLKK